MAANFNFAQRGLFLGIHWVIPSMSERNFSAYNFLMAMVIILLISGGFLSYALLNEVLIVLVLMVSAIRLFLFYQE